MPSPPKPQSIPTYIEDAARIAAILLVWGVIAAFFGYGLTELTSSFERVLTGLAGMFALAGVLNAILYVLYRTVDYWHEVV